MRSPEMRKKRRLRSVCAPHRRSTGTSIGPKLSFSVRLPLIAASMLRHSEADEMTRASSGEIEQQHFGALALFEDDRGRVGLERVARFQRRAINRDLAARDVNVGAPTFRERMRGALCAVEEPRIQARVLVDRHRAVGTVRGRNQAQPAALVRGREMLLLVGRRDAALRGLDPDLQEMRDALLVLVELAVGHAAAGAHALHVAGNDHRARAHRVLVRERAVEHVADDLHVAVPVGAEALAGVDAILVDHAQRAVAHVLRILVAGEGERVERAQPAVIREAAFGAAAHLVHVALPSVSACCAACWLLTSACTLAMSSDFAWAITCSSALPGSAPACWNRITFSRNTISVGIERMPKEPASSCCSSVFTLANTTSGWASEAFS